MSNDVEVKHGGSYKDVTHKVAGKEVANTNDVSNNGSQVEVPREMYGRLRVGGKQTINLGNYESCSIEYSIEEPYIIDPNSSENTRDNRDAKRIELSNEIANVLATEVENARRQK